MKNFKFLQKYMDLQKDVMYDQLFDLGFAEVGYCKNDKSSFWNLALIERPINKVQLSQIEVKLTKLDRKPALYFESQKNLIDFATTNKYSKTNEDCWLFYEGLDVDNRHFQNTKRVSNEEELKTFINTFDQCYQNDDPQNPYGKLGEYLDVARNAWIKHKDTDRLEYFITYKDDEPVGVATLNNYEDIGYISNVGSLRSVRGEGYGKAITLYCVAESKKKGAKFQCLATEDGNYPYDFYRRIGFTHKFTALLFVKQ